ncbi:prohead core scaffolding protein and protease [Synechococcus phage S-SZBM1]|uniref:Prohead core scaffolding protein and protease n=1 Tax=Synechococcus phage S-SZBM1 TaxID=2926475 RepID=A0AC61TTW9_9CAUD|nr:head maturation protease [Synechococcus phage S-SZBM1]UNH61295.1 prohead core scaffolding protein and protease [Synechococcus phage S-SZBM1]
MKLITETIEDAKVIITEGKNGQKKTYIEGVFLQGDITNRNGRMYPVSTLEREVEKYNENFVSKGRALGELGHPDGPIINLDRVSHLITSLKREGNNFIGKARILDTPMGRVAKELLDEGVKLGVSSRGLGSIKEQNGVKIVGEDFMLATAADIVADPSAPDAFVNGIMEGKEWIWNNGNIHESKLENIKKRIDNAARHQLEERKISAFHEFLQSL